MRKPIYGNNWKQAMLHAWLSFVLLAAFYLLSFGWPERQVVEPEFPTYQLEYPTDQEAYHDASRN